MNFASSAALFLVQPRRRAQRCDAARRHRAGGRGGRSDDRRRAEVVALGELGAGQLIVLRVLVRMKIAGTPGSGRSWKDERPLMERIVPRRAEHEVQRFEVWSQGSALKVRQSARLTNATGTRVPSPSGEGSFCLTLSATEALDYAPTGRSGEGSGALGWVLMPPAQNRRARPIARLWARLWCQRQARGMREGLSRR